MGEGGIKKKRERGWAPCAPITVHLYTVDFFKAVSRFEENLMSNYFKNYYSFTFITSNIVEFMKMSSIVWEKKEK